MRKGNFVFINKPTPKMKNPLIILLTLTTLTTFSQKKKTVGPVPQNTDKQTIISNIDKRFDEYAGISKQIWNYAELGYMEEKSSVLLQELLKKEGFNVQVGVAGIPTAFLATFGEGKPTIGILGEYDALPGLAQESVPEIKPIPNQCRLVKGNQELCCVNLL
jgi:aminobenzoyl-glutamate utilization protein B